MLLIFNQLQRHILCLNNVFDKGKSIICCLKSKPIAYSLREVFINTKNGISYYFHVF